MALFVMYNKIFKKDLLFTFKPEVSDLVVESIRGMKVRQRSKPAAQ